MAAKNLSVCVVSEIPNLFEAVKAACMNRVFRTSFVNPETATGSEPDLQQADIIVTEPHHCHLWLYNLPNLKMVQGTWSGIDWLVLIHFILSFHKYYTSNTLS